VASTDFGGVLATVDAVTIATPPATHKLLALGALRAGKHVVCEKPFTLGTTEARDLVAAAERAGVVALIGHEFRWATERAVLGRAVREGLIGEPRIATLVQYVDLVADPQSRMPGWWFDRRLGGGWLGASGSHLVDQLRVWLGEFSSVSAALNVVSDREVTAEDSFTIRARMINECDVVLQQSAGAFGPAAGMTRIAGTLGTISIEDGVTWLADATGIRALPVADELRLPAEPAASADPAHAFTHLEIGPYTRLCEAFYAGVVGRVATATVPLPTFADGLLDMQVLDAIRASAAAGGARVNV
jgi:predicted dehydrogenase